MKKQKKTRISWASFKTKKAAEVAYIKPRIKKEETRPRKVKFLGVYG